MSLNGRLKESGDVHDSPWPVVAVIFAFLYVSSIVGLIFEPLWYPIFLQSRDSNYNVSIPSASGCSQATALLARMDGSQNTPAVTTLICGMVTDGTYSLLDGLSVFATNSTANAQLNWAQNAFNLTKNGTETFSANNGFTGDGSTGYFDTGFNPSTAGGQYTQNSASMGACVLTSRTTSQAYVEIGNSNNATIFSYIEPLQTSLVNYELNGGTFPSLANSNAHGSWIVSRTSSSAIALYQNGSSVATPTDASVGLVANDIAIGAFDTGSGGIVDFSADQIAYALYGGGLTSTQAGNIYTRLHTYLVAVGAASGC